LCLDSPRHDVFRCTRDAYHRPVAVPTSIETGVPGPGCSNNCCGLPGSKCRRSS